MDCVSHCQRQANRRHVFMALLIVGAILLGLGSGAEAPQQRVPEAVFPDDSSMAPFAPPTLEDVATVYGEMACFSEDGMRLLTSLREQLFLWRLEHAGNGDIYAVGVASAALPAMAAQDPPRTQALALSPPGDIAAVALADGRVVTYRTVPRPRLSVEAVYPAMESRTLCVEVLPDIGCILAGGSDGTLRTLPVGEASVPAMDPLPPAPPITHVWGAADGSTVLVASTSAVAVWSIQHDAARQVACVEICIHDAVATSDGTWMCVGPGPAERIVNVWMINPMGSSAARITSTVDCPSAVVSATLSPDGSYLATSLRDRTVRLWQLATPPILVATFRTAPPVERLILSPDGSWLAGTSGRTTHLWQIRPAFGRRAPDERTSPLSSLPQVVNVGQDTILWGAAAGEPTGQPRLSVHAVILAADDPQQPATLRLSVGNDGSAPAHLLRAALLADPPLADAAASTVFLGTVLPGQTITRSVPLPSPQQADTRNRRLRLVFNEQWGHTPEPHAFDWPARRD